MTTDLYTVRPDDSAELVANLMNWERIRHVPVEDADHQLVGLVSYRTMLKRGGKLTHDNGEPILVSEIMRTDVLTVTPQTSTRDAIAFMSRFRVGCLPVIEDGKLVGILTEESFMNLASELLAGRSDD